MPIYSHPRLAPIITLYREELARAGIQVAAVFLYGSYAHGTQQEGSDIDVIVVSPTLVQIRFSS